MVLQEISQMLQDGRAKAVKELIEQALDDGISAQEILEKGLLAGMTEVREKFKDNRIYVPEVLTSTRAMNVGIRLLRPYLKENAYGIEAKVCVGTIRGDMHDVGKNLVCIMMEGKGLEVVDLGTDVEPRVFVETAVRENCSLICCSALLTTTMPGMEEIVQEAERAGIRDRVKIMIGGAPVTQAFCEQIGADAYTPDAASAADKAVELLKNLKK